MSRMVRTLVVGTALALLTAPGTLALAAGKFASHSRVTLKAQVGYDGHFRSGGWIPLRVTIHNRSNGTISGRVFTPARSASSGWPWSSWTSERGRYEMPVVLPGGSTKSVTIYIPAPQSSSVPVHFADSSSTLASTSSHGTQFSDHVISIGAVAADSGTVTWLRQLRAPGGGQSAYGFTGTGRLSFSHFVFRAGALDSVPQVLANLDAIVIRDTAVFPFTRRQKNALESYVRGGGTLVVIGGASWQQAISSLPTDLVPGRIEGTATLGDLKGLLRSEPQTNQCLAQPRPSHGRRARAQRGCQNRTVGVIKESSGFDSLSAQYPGGSDNPPRHWRSATVSVLRHPQGRVVASEQGIPLVVDATHGQGNILYLAFDPNFDPFAHWRGGESTVASALLAGMPQAVNRVNRSIGGYAYGSSIQTGGVIAPELDNVASPAEPQILTYGVVLGIGLLLLGPLCYVAACALRRREVLWLAIPALALLLTGTTMAVGNAARQPSIILNTVSLVTLTAPGKDQPADVYFGLFAPAPGSYHLAAGRPFLAQSVPQYITTVPSQSKPPLEAVLQEGGAHVLSFPHMSMWSTRDAELRTTVAVAGKILPKLHVNAHGQIVGTITNHSGLRLIHTAIIAGGHFVRLPALAPQGSARVLVDPTVNPYHRPKRSIWTKLYGAAEASNPYAIMRKLISSSGHGPVISFSSVRPAWSGVSQPFGAYGNNVLTTAFPNASISESTCCSGTLSPDKSFRERAQRVTSLLPEAQSVPQLGNVLFLGWNEQPLASVSVNGASVRQRAFNLMVQPLSVGLAHGPFTINPGTFPARLLQMTPGTNPSPRFYCCYTSGPQAVSITRRGAGLFEFDLPIPGNSSVHLTRLAFTLNAHGDDSTEMGRAWNWHTSRWTQLQMPNGFATVTQSDHFVSPSGKIFLRLVDTDPHRTLTLQDPNHDLQISARGAIQ